KPPKQSPVRQPVAPATPPPPPKAPTINAPAPAPAPSINTPAPSINTPAPSRGPQSPEWKPRPGGRSSVNTPGGGKTAGGGEDGLPNSGAVVIRQHHAQSAARILAPRTRPAQRGAPRARRRHRQCANGIRSQGTRQAQLQARGAGDAARPRRADPARRWDADRHPAARTRGRWRAATWPEAAERADGLQALPGTRRRRHARPLEAYTRIDHVRHEALAALDPKSGNVVGVVRYVCHPVEPTEAEVTYVVADAWQHRGV